VKRIEGQGGRDHRRGSRDRRACAKGAARRGGAVVVNDIDAAAGETVAAIMAEGGTASLRRPTFTILG